LQALLLGAPDPEREPAPAGGTGVEWEAPPSHAMLTDPMERLRFKLAHHNLRPDEGRPRIALAKPELGAERLEALYVARRSYRKLRTEPVPLADLGALLTALPRHGDLTLYLYAKPGRVAGLPGGTYRFDPETRRLTLLEEGATLMASLYDPVNHDIFASAGFALLFVAAPSTVAGWLLAALEAGRRAQILETAAPARRIGLAQMGGLRLDPVRSLFHLVPGDELVHTMLGGRIAAEQARLDAYLAEVAEYHALVDGLGAPPPAPPAHREPDVLADIREHLRARLPEYMVPPHLLPIDALPLSANGKVDRKALPEPEALRPSLATEYVAPATETEATLAGIWQTVLGLERVGTQDNFFDLGGDSIKGVRIIACASAEGLQLSVDQLFKHQTVAELARRVNELAAVPEVPALLPEANAGGFDADLSSDELDKIFSQLE